MPVERALDGMKQRQLGGAELYAHGIDFFNTHAVFAGDGAADIDRQLQDFGAEGLGAFEFAVLVGVVEYERVQVAVAGMKHVHAAQAVFR